MDAIIHSYEREVDSQPERRPEARKKLLDSKVPFPPFKVIDLHELKSSAKMRADLNKKNPFNPIHDSGVKKQLYLLNEIFQTSSSDQHSRSRTVSP